MLTARISGQTLEAIGEAFGITRERVRQIEVKWRLRGLIIPGARPLTEASRRLVYVPNGRPRGRRPVVKDDAYWSAKVTAVFSGKGAQ